MLHRLHCGSLLDTRNRERLETVREQQGDRDTGQRTTRVLDHCPGLSNPADLPSRGLTLLELSLNQLWRQGPPWLLAQDTNPDLELDFTMPTECVSEMKTSKEKTHNLLIITKAPTIGSLIRCEDFSTLTRLLRVTAHVLRAVKLFKRSKRAHSLQTNWLRPKGCGLLIHRRS